MKFNPEIFREYDIRGVYQKDLDDDFAYRLGQSYAVYLKRTLSASENEPLRVTVGHDARISSPAISKSLCQGFTESGVDVEFLGLITTPLSYFSMFHRPGMAGGVMVTGSHNPPDYNGFKISLGKSTIFGQEIQVVRKIFESGEKLSGQAKLSRYDILPEYMAHYQKEFVDLKPIPVVLDCGNGAAGIAARRLYEGVGLRPHILFEEPDGRFPNHHPDPTVEENLQTLAQAVRDTGAALGIGFDGDADRIGVVDENGRFVYGDELMVLISRAILAKTPGAKIVGDVKCSDRLYDDIKKRGGQPIMWKTGHSLIKNKIKEEKAPFGGELSGHVFFADRNYGYDDALYAGLRLVEILSQSGQKLSSLLSDLPSAYNTPEIRIDTTEAKKRFIVERLMAAFPKDTAEYQVNKIDGVRISFAHGWGLVRASNTQPVLVMRFEADSAQHLQTIRDQIEQIVHPLL